MEPVEIEDTQYVMDLKSGKVIDSIEEEEAVAVEADSSQEDIRVPKATDFSRYVFADLEKRSQKKEVDVELDQEEYKFDDGNYKVHNYRVKFSPDLVYGAAQYNTLWGFQGYTQLAFSDVLGNHKIYIGTNLVFDLRNSYISGQYWYLADRINWGVLGYHYANTIISSFNGLTRYRNYGMSLIASRPFNKFTRLDFSLNWFNVDMEYLQIDFPTQRTSSILPGLQLIHDTSEWGMTGPIDGFRGLLSLVVSPKYSPESLDFTTVKFDMRKYFKIASAYSFAFRATGGVSVGGNPQNFFLGGVPYWFNRQYSDGGGLRLDDIRDVYFSEFVTPLRGARYYEQTGNHFGLINAEFRFPLIPFIQLGFPPIALGNIMGVMFTDVGSAWTKFYDFRAVGDDGTLDDVVAGYGVGTRIFFLGLLFKYDVAWRFDFGSRNDEIHYFSMGIDF